MKALLQRLLRLVARTLTSWADGIRSLLARLEPSAPPPQWFRGRAGEAETLRRSRDARPPSPPGGERRRGPPGHAKRAARSEPPEHWERAARTEPPEHWLDHVRKKAPGLAEALEESAPTSTPYGRPVPGRDADGAAAGPRRRRPPADGGRSAEDPTTGAGYAGRDGRSPPDGGSHRGPEGRNDPRPPGSPEGATTREPFRRSPATAPPPGASPDLPGADLETESREGGVVRESRSRGSPTPSRPPSERNGSQERRPPEPPAGPGADARERARRPGPVRPAGGEGGGPPEPSAGSGPSAEEPRRSSDRPRPTPDAPPDADRARREEADRGRPHGTSEGGDGAGPGRRGRNRGPSRSDDPWPSLGAGERLEEDEPPRAERVLEDWRHRRKLEREHRGRWNG